MFLLFLILLLTAAGLQTWENYAFVGARAASTQQVLTLEMASDRFYHFARHFMVPPGKFDRAGLEARLPDPRPVATKTWIDPEGETLDSVTYRNPADGGEIVVTYVGTIWRGLGPVNSFAPTIILPPLWDLSNEIRSRVNRIIWPLWLLALVFYFLPSIRKPDDRENLSVLKKTAPGWIAVSLHYFGAPSRQDRVIRRLVLLASGSLLIVTEALIPWDWWPEVIRSDIERFFVWALVAIVSTVLCGLSFILMRITSGGDRSMDGIVCRTCGYDLRATPDRCPECGTAVVRV